ncbi:MAG: protein kinase [Myxococcales bacterium]|nr:protein kinase [Myxococcales bacterium]
MACPDENLIAGYIRGGLDPPSHRSVGEHIDGCRSCTVLVAELGRVMSTPPPPGTEIVSSSPASSIESVRAALARAGRYQLEDVLGSGGWGTVYRARDPELGRAVAVKVVRPDLTSDPQAVDRLQRRLLHEARAMAQVAHPNVVPIFEVQSSAEAVFLVMELVPGITLRAWLAQGHPPRRVMRMFREVGEGLVAAHNFGVIHRDFKPDNVLVGVDGRPRITDFGLAVELAPGAGRSEVVGTPAYAAPEQIFGHPLDARADQFAFAAALYEAIYGKPAFERGSIEHMRWVYATQSARPPQSVRDIGAGVGPVLMRALSLRPEQRFPTMRMLLDELDAASHTDELLHVRINAVVQLLATPAHVAFLVGWSRKVDEVTAAREASPPNASSETSDGFDVLLGAGLVIVILLGMGWLTLGVLWAPFNAWALLTRRRFGRISTMVYAALSALSCVGIPYAVYAIWSLRRPHVRALFEAAPLSKRKR